MPGYQPQFTCPTIPDSPIHFSNVLSPLLFSMISCRTVWSVLRNHAITLLLLVAPPSTLLRFVVDRILRPLQLSCYAPRQDPILIPAAGELFDRAESLGRCQLLPCYNLRSRFSRRKNKKSRIKCVVARAFLVRELGNAARSGAAVAGLIVTVGIRWSSLLR